MNRKIALSLVLATAAAGALADDITIETTTFKSTLTRAEVQAALQQHRQSGIDPWADHYDHLKDFRSDRTRAEVQAEYIAARDEVHALNAEDSGAAYLARRMMPRSVGPQLAALPGAAE
jgi:hypothetical protein